MSAKSRWWYCGNCGFANHPRAEADHTRCEQCGADQEHDEAIDYVPSQGGA